MARLAEECGLSRSYFTKAFKCSTGVSPHEWLMRMRVDRAKELMLGSDEPLSQIGVACGFFRPAAFLADLSPAGRRLALDLASGQAAAHRRSALNRDRA